MTLISLNLIKLCGVILILLSSIAAGVSYSSRLHERVKMLISLKTLVIALGNELSMYMPELPDVYSSNRDERTKPLTDDLSAAMNEGLSPDEAAERAFSSETAKRLLLPDEREFLAAVFAQLGSGDLQSADKLLSGAEKRLETYISAAEEKEKKSSKVGMAAAVYIGLAAVILMM